MSALGDFLQVRLAAAANHYDRLAALLELAGDLALTDPAEGLAHAERAMELARSANDRAAQAGAYRERGLCLLGLGETERSLADLGSAREIYKDLDDAAGLAGVALALGEVRLYLGHYREAVAHYQSGLAAAEGTDSARVTVALLQGMANVYAAMGDHEQAFRLYEEAVQHVRELNDRGMTGALISDMALLAMARGDNRNALDQFRAALGLFDDHRYDRLMVRTRCNIANLLYVLDDLDGAKLEAQRAWHIARSLGEMRQALIAMSTLGNVLEKEGDIATALEHQERALAALTAMGANGGAENRRLQTVLLLNIANLYRKLGDSEQAVVLAQEVTQFAGVGGEPAVRYRAHEMLAEIYERRRDLERALFHMKRMNALREETCNAERERIAAEMQARFDVERMKQTQELLEDTLERITDDNRAVGLTLIKLQGLISHFERELPRLRGLCTGEALKCVRALQAEVRKYQEAADRQEHLVEVLLHVDREFVQRLVKCCPELTGKELITCGLIRLGLDSKAIAELEHVDVRAIDKRRERIRAKIRDRGADPGDDLASFLMQI
ncbi:MAG: tetratricopeptide repeat protein [Bacteroidetes bacterium]|nr:tetratricopeptide repeat protein [Bacteroidota bacterium]